MRKKIIILTAAIAMGISLAACSPGSNGETTPTEATTTATPTVAEAGTGTQAEATTEAPTEMVYEAQPEETTTPVATATGLAGNWDWLGSPYYVLYENGEGTMVGMPIRWWHENGVFSICVTPNLCEYVCTAPTEWYYTLSGNNLNLVNTMIDGMEFDYTRR